MNNPLKRLRPAGFKLGRYREWARVVATEGRRVMWLGVLRDISKAGLRWMLTGFKSNGTTWRTRMRTCWNCPVYDRERRACRQRDLGCGCYMPFKAMSPKAGCWLRESGIDVPFGWKE